MSASTVRTVLITDAAAIAEIYNYYVTRTTVSFEETPVSAEQMAQRIAAVLDQQLPWLVAELDGELVGYAYASRWKERSAYRFAVESSVYLRHGLAARGLGTQLYRQLLADLHKAGKHTVIGGVTLPNEASIGLHRKLGFEQVALFRQVGYKFDRWLDVSYWQLHLPD